MSNPAQSTPSIKKPSILLATWFGCGLMSPAPGTWGSLGALPFAIAIFYVFGFWAFIATILFFTPIAFWATAQYEAAADTHDSKQIVIDEVIGQWIALIPVFYILQINWIGIIVAFALFRLFDVTKPWPISHFDKNVSGATGVMVDDIIAGIFAAILIIGGLYAWVG